jgi:hypothetical protein
MFERVKTIRTKIGLNLFLVGSPPAVSCRNKAVADGAVSFYLDHHVRTQIAKVTYGSRVTVPYVDSDPEHIRRAAQKFIDVDMLPFGFRTIRAARTILPKVRLTPYIQ